MNKTKRLFGFVLALLLTNISFGQVSLGVQVGTNFSNISTPDLSLVGIPSTKSNMSFTYGLVADIGIKNGFSIQPELNVSKKGFVIKENIPIDLLDIELPIGVKAVTDLNYVEMPVLGKYSFGNEKVGAYVTAGPTVSYATSGRFRTVADLFFIDINLVNQKFDLDALNVSRMDIGGTIGMGGTVNLGNTKWFVDAKYTHGFNKLDNIPVIDLDFRNRNFAITTGIMIPITTTYSGPRA